MGQKNYEINQGKYEYKRKGRLTIGEEIYYQVTMNKIRDNSMKYIEFLRRMKK